MKLGAMNNPMVDVIEEIEMFRDLGFDFIDLTLEPQQAYSKTIDVKSVRAALERTGLDIIGHTGWYLPIASPYPELRELAVRELENCLMVLSELGADKMNVHPNLKAPLHDLDWIVAQNIAALARLVDKGNEIGMKVMLENMPGFSRVSEVGAILDAVPGAYFLLDIAHANLDTPYNRSEELIANFGNRLAHVHVSDNKGGHDDMHLPLGVGTINWRRKVKILKEAGYDGTITVEVFGEDDDYLVMSRDKLKKLWEES